MGFTSVRRLPEKGFDWPSSLQAAESLTKCPRLEARWPRSWPGYTDVQLQAENESWKQMQNSIFKFNHAEHSFGKTVKHVKHPGSPNISSMFTNYLPLVTEPWHWSMPGVSCQLGWTREPCVVLTPPAQRAQRAQQLQRGLHRQVVPAGGAALVGVMSRVQDFGDQHESTIL